MAILQSTMLFIVHILLLLGLSTFLVDAAPMPQASASAATSDFWVSTIKRQGTTPFGQSNYQVYRNVKDYGAKGKTHFPCIHCTN